MTVKEAIDRLKYDRAMCYFNPSTGVAGEPYDEDCKEMAEALDIAIKILENGSAEQTEQKTGRWIYKERDVLINTGCVSYGENGAVQEKRWTKVKRPYCSECGWYEDSEYEATPYCPNCGAKMESEESE